MAVCAAAALAWAGLLLAPGLAAAVSYWAETVLAADELKQFVLEQSLTVPLDLRTPLLGHPLFAELKLRHRTAAGEGAALAGGGLTAAAGPWEGYVVRDEDHRSSTEPFRLVHRSARAQGAWAGGLQWRGDWSALLQYVQAVPLRGRTGPLLVGQAEPSPPWPRLTWVGYGTEQLQHQFFVLDGAFRLSPNMRVAWGGVWQTGREVAPPLEAPGLIQVSEAAAFARLEATRGRHRLWFTVHATSPGFRSLAADTYPFHRGQAGVEGRWQFRPQANHLLSVYGEVREPLDDATAPFRAVEVRYSVAPRRRWAWHLGALAEWEGSAAPVVTWQVGGRDPDRRLDASLELETGGNRLRWRPRLEWEANGWRMVTTADTDLPGWRVQWVHSGHPFWQLTLVYKERRDKGAGGQARAWTHVRLARRLPERGEVWVRWGEWDQGRLDVGWSRPPTVAVGVSLSF
ncbi:MAG TPA: hypothetical protein VIK93_01525 [Limnochordales bacterium]